MVCTVMTWPAATRSSQVSPSPPANRVLLTVAEVAPGAKLMRVEPPGGGPPLAVAVGAAVAGATVAGAAVEVAAAGIAVAVAETLPCTVAVAAAVPGWGVAVAGATVAGATVAGATMAVGVSRLTSSSPAPRRQAASDRASRTTKKIRDRLLRDIDILHAPIDFALTHSAARQRCTRPSIASWWAASVKEVTDGLSAPLRPPRAAFVPLPAAPFWATILSPWTST